MKYRHYLILLPTVALLFAPPSAAKEEKPPKIDSYDVVLLVDGTPGMAPLARKSSYVVTEAMGDRHRLGIVTFGEQATVRMPLSKIATVTEKDAALDVLKNAPFEDTQIDLAAGINGAMAMLTDGSGPEAKKIILLLAGSKGKFGETDAAAFREQMVPSMLKRGIALYATALPDSDTTLLASAAGLTGGKCLGAFNVETVTDALDLIVASLQPQKEVVVEKTVPVKTVVTQVQEMSPDEKHRRNEAAARQRTVIAVSGATVGLMLLAVLGMQWMVYRRLSPEKKGLRKAAGAKDKSSFAALRDLAAALNNASVDTHEMIEQLNLDLEDFGVEKWRVEKMLEKRFAELVLGLVLVIDHLKLEGTADPSAARLCDKLERALEDAGVREIPAAVGEKFDSGRHKAVETRTGEAEPGCIAAVLRPGFEVSDKEKDAARVLRQTEVAVGDASGTERKKP